MAMTQEALEQPKVTNGFKYETHRWGTDAAFLRSLQVRAADIYKRAFGLDILQTADEIYYQMQRDPLYRRSITIATSHGRDIGFLIQELVMIPVQGREIPVVLNDSRAVDKKFRRRGVATEIFRKGYLAYEENNPAGAVGRTQVEPIIESLISSGLFYLVLPIHRDFKGWERQIPAHLNREVFLYKGESLNDRTGLVTKVYPEGEVGGYELDLSHPGIRLIHERFKEIGLNKKRGDADIYFAKDRNY